MNSVLAYKQFSLGEGLADLFATEIKNFEAFKVSLSSRVKLFWNSLGYENCTTTWKDSGNWKEGWKECK